MKMGVHKVCISSSFRNWEKVKKLKKELEEEGFEVYTPIPADFRKDGEPSQFKEEIEEMGKEKLMEEAKKVIYPFFEKLGNSDLNYVIAKDGYVGKSVSAEIGYAYALDIPIFSSEPIEDVGIAVLVDEVVPETELLEKLKELKR